jgi:hypothetical protein
MPCFPFAAVQNWFSRRAALFLLLTAGPLAAQDVQRYPIGDDGSEVEVENVFSLVPPTGYAPVRVTLKNISAREAVVSIGTSSGTSSWRSENLLTSSQPDFKAAAETSTEMELIVPVMTDFSDRTGYRPYAESHLEISAPVLASRFAASFRGNVLPGIPFAAASQSLVGKSGAALNEAAQKKFLGSSSGYGREGSFLAVYLPAHLPSDWRGFSGLDLLAVNNDEWDALQPGVRLAVRQWMMQGGVLDVYHSGPEPAAVLQELKTGAIGPNAVYPLGAGGVRFFPWDGKELPAETLSRFEASSGIVSRNLAAQRALVDGDKVDPVAGLSEALGVRSFAAWQVGVILVVFGLLVGPINLFYLAGPGRRHRLFFTTPLIAVGASILLMAVIFLQDGSGGSGKRAALVELYPEENTAVLRQYQVSRTGVLWGGGFTIDQAAVITPMMLANTRWTRLKPSGASDSEGQRYNLPEPLVYAGDWFQSRSEQAQLIEAIRPGRGRFELKPGGGDPVVVSSFPGKVEQFYYHDATGQPWVSQAPITAGASVTLQKTDKAAAEAWLEQQLLMFPKGERGRVGASLQPGSYFAFSSDPQSGLMDSLKSIKWENDHILLHGRFATAP